MTAQGGHRVAFRHLKFARECARLRALPAWFTLAAYGREGHREIVERDIDAAHRLASRLAELPQVHMAAPVRLNAVCFTVDGLTPAQVADALTASDER